MLGLTGSGKSSLINYLLGAKDLIKVVKKGTDYHMFNEDQIHYPKIGNEQVSCTDIPSRYAGKSGIQYIDPAGFMDTKGDIQEIVNAYANAKMFQKGIKTKIILTIDINTLRSGRGGNLPAIARRLLDLFPKDFKVLMNSIMIVVTKVNPEDDSIEDLVERIDEINKSNANIPAECSILLNTIVEKKNVRIFPFPRFIDNQAIDELK